MNALKVFNIIYGLKKIEENGLLDKVNLKRPDCEFSYLLNIANENKDLNGSNIEYTLKCLRTEKSFTIGYGNKTVTKSSLKNYQKVTFFN